MANHGVVQSSGTEVNPGQWIQIVFNDGREFVGRFSGVWNNPRYGLMFSLSYARLTDGSSKPETIFCMLEPDGDIEAAIDSAKIVEKPSKRKPSGGATIH